MQKAKQMWLFTNRNCLVFDANGEQIPEYQASITCYTLNKKLAEQACNEAEEFHIGKWESWEHPISREEMKYILGVAKRE